MYPRATKRDQVLGRMTTARSHLVLRTTTTATRRAFRHPQENNEVQLSLSSTAALAHLQIKQIKQRSSALSFLMGVTLRGGKLLAKLKLSQHLLYISPPSTSPLFSHSLPRLPITMSRRELSQLKRLTPAEVHSPRKLRARRQPSSVTKTSFFKEHQDMVFSIPELRANIIAYLTKKKSER